MKEAGPSRGGTLYVVATPIGNMGDITLRALDVLRTVPLVAAEDTRMTRRLWGRYDITTKLVSYHAASPARRHEELLDHLRADRDLALVTDAGTPLVSDPGDNLVDDWISLGGRVVPIPGASAVLAALVASGIPAPRWTFEGFLPRSGRDRRERLARISAADRASVVFEAPGRTKATLVDLARECGGDRVAALCRELTKLHEEVLRAPLGELARRAAESPPRGEVTIVVAAAPVVEASEASESAMQDALEEARGEVDALVGSGLSRAAAARTVALKRGVPRRLIYGS